ncbi:hypothetical protein [Halopiger goleimassiliensis]|nr:hypothetical protein [Halopiger goleimassiliensis]
MVSTSRLIHVVMVLSSVGFAALEYAGYFERGNTFGMIIGTSR